MKDCKESDWKHFRNSLEDLRERYLQMRNTEIVAIATDPSKTATEQFWDSLEKMKEIEEILNRCLIGYKRSNMLFHIHSMYGYGMITDEDLAHYSEELQEDVKRSI